MWFIEILPHSNALMNLGASICIILAYQKIKKKDVIKHQYFIERSILFSILFLIGYIIRISFGGIHRFPDIGFIKTFYLCILITHSILAVINIPLISFAFYFAKKKNFTAHKRIVRFALPIWLYVSVTGIFVYCMLYHIGPALQ